MGRPRDSSIHDHAIAAAIACYAELGWSGFNFDVVATRAGVGRPALYRRWSDRTELLIDAFRETSAPAEEVDHGSLAADLLAIGRGYAAMMRGERGRAGARLFIERELAADVYEVVSREISGQRDAAVFAAIERGRHRGEIREGLSSWTVRSMLLGPLFILDLFPPREIALPDDHVAEIVEVLIAGVSGGSAS